MNETTTADYLQLPDFPPTYPAPVSFVLRKLEMVRSDLVRMINDDRSVLAGVVMSVNGKAPDESKNVSLAASDVPATEKVGGVDVQTTVQARLDDTASGVSSALSAAAANKDALAKHEAQTDNFAAWKNGTSVTVGQDATATEGGYAFGGGASASASGFAFGGGASAEYAGFAFGSSASASNGYAFGGGASASAGGFAFGDYAYANGTICVGIRATPEDFYFGSFTEDEGASARSLQSYLNEKADATALSTLSESVSILSAKVDDANAALEEVA